VLRTGGRRPLAGRQTRTSSSPFPRPGRPCGRSRGLRRSARAAGCGGSAWSSRWPTIRTTASGAGPPPRTGSGPGGVGGGPL